MENKVPHINDHKAIPFKTVLALVLAAIVAVFGFSQIDGGKALAYVADDVEIYIDSDASVSEEMLIDYADRLMTFYQHAEHDGDKPFHDLPVGLSMCQSGFAEAYSLTAVDEEKVIEECGRFPRELKEQPVSLQNLVHSIENVLLLRPWDKNLSPIPVDGFRGYYLKDLQGKLLEGPIPEENVDDEIESLFAYLKYSVSSFTIRFDPYGKYMYEHESFPEEWAVTSISLQLVGDGDTLPLITVSLQRKTSHRGDDLEITSSECAILNGKIYCAHIADIDDDSLDIIIEYMRNNAEYMREYESKQD